MGCSGYIVYNIFPTESKTDYNEYIVYNVHPNQTHFGGELFRFTVKKSKAGALFHCQSFPCNCPYNKFGPHPWSWFEFQTDMASLITNSVILVFFLFLPLLFFLLINDLVIPVPEMTQLKPRLSAFLDHQTNNKTNKYTKQQKSSSYQRPGQWPVVIPVTQMTQFKPRLSTFCNHQTRSKQTYMTN